VKQHVPPRDYLQDFDAHLSVKAADFSLTSLAVWQELVASKLTAVSSVFRHSGGQSALEVEEAEEAAIEAGFREVIARTAADEKDFLAWKMQKVQAEGRKHVLMVQHHKSQNMKGAACDSWL
jgi:hypothetical protein